MLPRRKGAGAHSHPSRGDTGASHSWFSVQPVPLEFSDEAISANTSLTLHQNSAADCSPGPTPASCSSLRFYQAGLLGQYLLLKLTGFQQGRDTYLQGLFRSFTGLLTFVSSAFLERPS